MDRVILKKNLLDLIDWNDERFRSSYHFAVGPLKLSLEQVGLLHPLVLVARAERLVILSGWKRALVLKEMGVGNKETEAVLLDEPDDLAAFRRVFLENASFRTFTFLEKMMIVRRWLELGEEEAVVISEVLPFLQLSPTKATLEMMRSLNGEDPAVQRFLQEKEISPATAALLSAMTSSERNRITPLLAPLGRNKQRDLVEDLVDLSMRYEKPVDEILDFPDIHRVIEDTRRSALQKSEQIREMLNRAKNPRYWTWKDSAERSIRKLGLPPGTGIKTSLSFESDEMTLALSFETAEEFRRKLKELDRLCSGEEFDALFRDPEDSSE